MSRSHVRHGSDFIRYAAEKAPAGATNQTQGVLNTRGRFGSRRRSTRIPTDTITNASSVPIETRLAASRIGRIAAKKATMTPVTMERSEEHTSELQSLRHLVCRLLLEKKTR